MAALGVSPTGFEPFCGHEAEPYGLLAILAFSYQKHVSLRLNKLSFRGAVMGMRLRG